MSSCVSDKTSVQMWTNMSAVCDDVTAEVPLTFIKVITKDIDFVLRLFETFIMYKVKML